MKHDKIIAISVAGNRFSTKWQPQTLKWSELVGKLEKPVRSTETLQAYLHLSRAERDELKDIGGFVGGYLSGARKTANLRDRDVITLDLDNIPAGGTEGVINALEALGCAYAVYSTRKHDPYAPRLRVLLPLDKAVSADQYCAIGRKLAEKIGIGMCDRSTFEPTRLMYWPSCCADSEYVFTCADKPFVSADGVLGLYKDWQDMREWPVVPGEEVPKQTLAKQGDPRTKPGIVGAFCRLYDVYTAIDKYIPDAYAECDAPDRLTYTYGSTAAGAVVYDNGAFLYSHHATDPAGCKLCNAFDLIRYHKFADLDDEAKPNTPIARMPSYEAMLKLAMEDENVAADMLQTRYDRAVEDFKDGEEVTEVKPVAEVTSWQKALKRDGNGGAANTIKNVITVIENDPLLKGAVAFDEFAQRLTVLGPLPWNKSKDRRPWCDVDDSGIRFYLEAVYGVTGKERIEDGVQLVAHRNIVNEVRDFILGTEWDGVGRLDTLLIDYLGAEDTPYVRAVTRKAFVAAVARVLMPGVKFDNMTILTGPQGIGKSTLLGIMGGKWFSDSLITFEGKEAYEIIQGSWIVEISELQAFTKAENSAVKQFLSKREDKFRAAYGHHTSVCPRRCVFFGTTNESEFLRDRTGNRRSWAVTCYVNKPTKNVFNELSGVVGQLWAEAHYYFMLGEELMLDGAMEIEAGVQQERYKESNPKEGLIREFLDRPVPFDWDKRDMKARAVYWLNEFGSGKDERLVPRDRVCAVELFVEALGGDLRFMKRSDTVEINGILDGFRDWKKEVKAVRFGPYGPQKGYVKST